MVAWLQSTAWPADSPSVEKADSRQALWLALELLDPPADPAALISLADWAESLTSNVVLCPGEGLLLEVHGSLKYFSGLAGIRRRLTAELDRRGLSSRLATAPTPLAAAWLVRYRSVDIPDQAALASAIGSLPLAVTAWPAKVQQMLGQMGLRSIADCLRLPRAGFARRVGQVWLDELDRALGKKPDPRTPHRTVQKLHRAVEFAAETGDMVLVAEALNRMAVSLEHELRQRQLQVQAIELEFSHLRTRNTRTRIGFVDPVHEHERILKPLLARIERLSLSEPAVAVSLETSSPLPLKTEMPELLGVLPGKRLPKARRAVPEFALVECLRGRFGTRRVYGIGAVAAHRPEHAWRHRIDPPAAGVRSGNPDHPACPLQARPLWLLPTPEKRGQSPFYSLKKGSDPFSGIERIESGWWDGQDVRRDYHIVVGPGGEKLWLYRDCRTHQWYLHGIFG